MALVIDVRSWSSVNSDAIASVCFVQDGRGEYEEASELRARGRLRGAEQQVGDAAHGRRDDDDLVTGTVQVGRDARRLRDGIGGADRGVTKLDDQT